MQGDALKEILCIPYVLAAKYQSYFNKPWDEPLIIRNGFGKAFEIRLAVDKIARYNYADIHPYDLRLSKIVNPNVLWLVLVKVNGFVYVVCAPGKTYE